MLLLGLVAGFIPTATFTLAPETMPNPQFAGVALGLISIGQNLGLFVGPPIVGAIIANGNWSAGVIPMMVPIAIGLAASLLLYSQSTQTRRELNKVHV